MLCGGGFELSLVFRARFVGALLDRGLGPLAPNIAAPLHPPVRMCRRLSLPSLLLAYF